MLLPGFVDLQVNGFMGVDFSSAELTPESCATACRSLLGQGTAAFLPTIVTSSEETYRRNLAIMATVMEADEFKGRLLGIHTEGPFISNVSGAVGAHNPDCARRPAIDFFSRLQEWAGGHIRLVTLAAELDGAADLTRALTDQGVVVSLGHQMASSEDLARLADAGARCITHLGNGMPNMVDRHHNPLLAGLAEDRLTAMVITDGHHLPEYLVRLIIRCKTTKRMIVTSDAAAVAGLAPGNYEVLGNRAMLREDGLFYNPDKNCMVGSSFTMLQCANWLLKHKLLSVNEIVQTAWNNPLALLAIPESSLESTPTVRYDHSDNQFAIA